MPQILFENSAGQKKLIWDSTNKMAQMIAAECSYCPDLTPNKIQITLSGILICDNLNVCCQDSLTGRKILDQGSGWSLTTTLTQGRIFYGTGEEGGPPDDIRFERVDFAPCWWSNILRGDFGYFDVYNLDDPPCTGGVAGREFFHALGVHVLATASDATNIYLQVYAALAFSGFSGGIWPIFYYNGYFAKASYPNKCHPYESSLNNSYICHAGTLPCIGNGTAVISEI